MHPIPTPITALYAALLGLMLVPLTIFVIRIRRREQISLLEGGRDDLTRAIRAHGNFTEFAPLSLILILLLELNGAHPAAVHALGGLLVASRVSHAYAILAAPTLTPRVLGMIGTFAVLGFASLLLLATGLGWR